jgi:hypothetical protein
LLDNPKQRRGRRVTAHGRDANSGTIDIGGAAFWHIASIAAVHE